MLLNHDSDSGIESLVFNCVSCGTLSEADPNTVPSVSINPRTGLPPDTKPNGEKFKPSQRELDQAYDNRQPICTSCAAKLMTTGHILLRSRITQDEWERIYGTGTGTDGEGNSSSPN